jgi:hypothetical protein
MVVTKLVYVNGRKIELHPVKHSNYNYQEFCLGIYKNNSSKYDIEWKWRTENILYINKPSNMSDGDYYLCIIFENALVVDYMFVKSTEIDNLTTPNFVKINYLITISSDNINFFEDTTITGNIATSSTRGIRTSSLVVAASDSTTKSKVTADYVCDGVDDQVEINAAIDILKNYNTTSIQGKIVLMEGTYNISSPILVYNKITIEGQGYSTHLKRKANTNTSILQWGNLLVDNAIIKDFYIDGNKDNQTVPAVALNFTENDTITAENIVVANNYGNAFYNLYKCVNCEAIAGTTIGFDHCNRLVNCMAVSNAGDGFAGCIQVNNCYASGNSACGFFTCYRLASCEARSNTNAGFHTSWVISSSLSYGNNNGFYECRMITGCWSYDNSNDGFQSCRVVTGCYSNNNGRHGFRTTHEVSGCWANKNTNYGFYDCERLAGILSNFNTNGMGNIDYGSCIHTNNNTSSQWAGTNTKIDNDSSN